LTELPYTNGAKVLVVVEPNACPKRDPAKVDYVL
jgi:hypothetical protein